MDSRRGGTHLYLCIVLYTIEIGIYFSTLECSTTKIDCGFFPKKNSRNQRGGGGSGRCFSLLLNT